jgi:hypothetical protein
MTFAQRRNRLTTHFSERIAVVKRCMSVQQIKAKLGLRGRSEPDGVQFIKKNPTRCKNVSKFYYCIFIWNSTCFGRHTAHHQETKTALVASGFSYLEGCWTCSWWTLSGTYCAWQRPPTTRPTTFHECKTRGCQCSFRLLMMGGVSPETCSASCKYEIKFWYTVASCWISYVKC